VLRVKSLTINIVADVAGFPDLHINLACRALLRGNFMVLPPRFCRSLSDGYIYTASEGAKDEKQ
jgi:hypothetical protein